VARLEANLAAISVVKALQAEGRPATPAEQEILARWSGWGAVSAVFEEEPGESRTLARGREQLRKLLSDKEYAAARRNTINAHYTSPALAQAMWDGLAALGFHGGRVLEPGCGAGTFIGLAPLGTAMVGIELDPVTAHIAAALYPHAQVRNEDFADTQLPEGSFDAVIGNVPFGSIHMKDPRYNPGRKHPIHTHFLLKSAALVRPGGWIALITSRYTMDAGDDADDAAVEARRKLAGLGELAAAIRLPTSAHRRTAGTNVVTDVLVIRRFADGEQPPADEPAWLQTIPVDVGGVQIPVNRYFADHPGMVLGEMTTGGARRADDLRVTAPAGTDAAVGLAQALARTAADRAAAPRLATAPAAMDRPPEGFLKARRDGTFAQITDGFYEPFDPPGGAAGRAELRALLGLRDTALALLDAELATSEDAGLVDDLRADLNARYDAYTARYGPVNRHTRQVRPRETPAGRELRERLLAEGHAQITGGKVEISDPAVRDHLVAAGHATVTETGELRFARTAAARAERQRLLDSGQARRQGGIVTLTGTGRDWVLENAADLGDAVTIIRQRPAQGGFRKDPFAVRVLALEKYDPESGTARKNDIMRHRVLLPRPAVEHADDPEDALAVCMDRHARVRLDVIAELLGTASEQEARDRLGTLVFHDPAEGHLVPAPEYLSGDVRAKLRQAREAAADDPACQANVEALAQVIPPDLGPAEIEARLGAVFITPAEVQQFLRETLADHAVTVTLAADGTWSVKGGDRHSVAATLTWGTKDRDAMSLAEHILNRKGPVEVKRKDSEGKTWTDEEATAAAREKQAELSDRFAGWAWEDLDRATEICRRYNDAFNSIVLRSYDDVILSLPGVNREIKPFWWQKAAIARMIYEPTAGLFHDMGAGKTLEQIIGVMEQKRLGLIRKPVICVKNHLLDQFRDEFLWAYPQARVMCADSDDLAGEGRRQFIARCASENPDAIIMTRGAFESIPLTPEGHEAYLDYMKQMFAVHAEAVADTVKDEETLLAEFEQRLRAYFDPDAQEDEEEEDEPDRKRGKRKVEQDPAVCWEQMGIDYICIDESQDYNNLWVPSDEPGMAIDFVHRAIDLEMKLHATRARYGSRVCTLATGTPVTNKIPQFYVLQRYLRPERLKKAGFAGFAPWAATYTEPEQRLEMKANGQFGMVTRMRLINFPELLLDLHYFGDFKDADDIGMKRPAIRGGKPEIRGVPAVPELLDYQATLPERYNKAKVGGKKHKGDDTVVAVIGDGFRAAQDLRLVKARHGAAPRMTDEPQKIDHIADDIYAEWAAHRDDVYPGEDGQPDPVVGSLQLVFCNEGVPKSDDWNLYDELRSLLIERGMPRQAIRFIHEAGSDGRKKAALFAACNVGHVAVLMGSTEKMGVGTNVQRRCIGVHHVHPHWRPDYDAQEDARARRHGNLNTEVFIKRWITEGSFDTIRAQACERKSVFLRVVKHRDTTVRSIDAPGDDTVSYAEIAAVGAGEPRLIQKAQLESELQQLARAHRRHVNNQNALKVAGQQARAAITAAEQTIRDIDAAAGRIIPTSGDDFRMTIDGTAFTARRDAGDHLTSCLRAARARIPVGTCQTSTIGTLGGFQLTADLAHDGREHTIVLRLEQLPGAVLQLDHRKLLPGIGLVTRLENKLSGLDKLRLEQHAIIDRQSQELTRAQSAIGAPFPQQDALLATQRALDDLIAELRDDKNNKNGTDGKTATAGSAATAGEPAGPQYDEDHGTGPAAGTSPVQAAAQAPVPIVQVAGRPAIETTGHTPAASPAHHASQAATPADPGQETARAGSPAGNGTQQAAGMVSRPAIGPEPATTRPAPDAQTRLLMAVLGGYSDPAELAAAQAEIEHTWQEADGTGLAAGPLRTQYDQLHESVLAAGHARDTYAALVGYQAVVQQAAQLSDAGWQPAEYVLGRAARQLSAAASAHLARLAATGGAADGLLNAAAGQRLQAGGQNPVPAFPDPLGQHPEPYQDGTEARQARESIFRSRDTWLRELRGSGLPEDATWLPGVLERLERTPDRDHLPHQRATWNEAVSAALDATSGPAASPALSGLLSAIYRHRQRLDAYHIQARYAPAPYDSADAYTAGHEEIRQARQAWQESMTGSRLRDLTDRQARGTSWWDIRAAQRDASGALTAAASAAAIGDDLEYAARQALGAADACHALRLSLNRADYASPADYASLDALTRAAHRHAARLGAARDTGLAPALGAALAERAATAPVPGQNHEDQEQPAAAGPVGETVTGLVIEHDHQGTLVRGTDKNDQQLRSLLRQQGFKWSGNLNAWYLPRPWTYSTRNRRVDGLTAGLRQARRSFTTRSQSPASEGADDSPPDPRPEAVTQAPARPAASNPHHGASPADDELPRQDSSKYDHPAGLAGAVPGPSADTAGDLPAVCRNAADLRQLAAACLLSTITEPGAARGTQLTVVRDHGRTVLLHDDISGTSAGGHRLDPGEVPAYLTAYLRHPQLPPRCLLDLAREDPAAPDILTLAAARETAARHDLDVRVRRVAGRSYITFCEPGITGLPVLSCPAGTGSALHGPAIVPAVAIDSYLLTYRHSIPSAMFTVSSAPPDWARRVTQLTPHLIDEGGYFISAAREHLMAAFAAARDGNADEAARLLSQAESVTPPLTVSPEREDELIAAITRHAPRYGYTEDPAGYMARAVPALLDASDREWDWVRSYIAAHPHVRENTAQEGPAPGTRQPEDDREAAVGKLRQARAASETGDHEQALALIDEAELLYPDGRARCEAVREQVRSVMSQAGSPQPAHQDSPGSPAPATDTAPPAAPGQPATIAEDAGVIASPGTPTAPARHDQHDTAGPPDGTQPLAAHTGWTGNLRPERLLYADGTPLTIRGQGDDNDQALPATAVGTVSAPADSEYGPGRLQVIRWNDGRHGVVHPALASPRHIDPYTGLSDRDRARWEAFDLAEAWPTPVAGLRPHLIDIGDVLQVERGPRSHTTDMREVQSVHPGTGALADGLEFKVTGLRSRLFYPPDRLVPVFIPDEHPSLPAALQAALAATPESSRTVGPVPAISPAAAGETATRATAPGHPGTASAPAPVAQGRYSSRIRISDAFGRPAVSGTSYADDPPEVRDTLRANGFRWRKQRQVWEYTGRETGKDAAVTAIRDLLARLDRAPAAPAAGEFAPTSQQQAILDAFLDGKTIAVQALAGTGKTTTLVLLARALMDRSPDARIVYTAFNADIVADARSGRFGRNVTASTMHSLAKQALLQTGYAAKIEHADKGARWPEQWAEVLGIPEVTAAGTGADPVPADAVARLVIATVRKFRESADDEPGRQHLPGHLTGPVSPLGKSVLSYARKAWADISDTSNAALLASGRALRVDHDDYLKVWALSRPRINAGVIFFDEAQDVNAVMRRVILDQSAQTVVVGDSHQSIYGFRGAIDALKDWPADIVLPLTQSWRFGPDAAGFGNLFLRSLGSKLLLEGSPARNTRLGSAAEPDAILCRTNASAVAEVFTGLESGKRTALAGGGQSIREIAKAARDLQTGRGTKHPDLSRFTDWDEVRHYAQHEEDGKSLQVFVRLVDRHGPDGLIDMIGRLTPEGDTRNPPQLTISTAHKAKGREWDTVRIAGDFRGPVTDPETGEVTWPVPEERRLAYVAATRARKLLEPGSLSWIYDYPQDISPAKQHEQREHREQPTQGLPAATEDQPAATAQPAQVPDPDAAVPARTREAAPAPAAGHGPGEVGSDASVGAPGDGQEAAGPEPPDAHREAVPADGTSTVPASAQAETEHSKEVPAATAGSRLGTHERTAADGDTDAGQVLEDARRHAQAREQARVPIDRERANALIRRQRTALTRAVNSKDPAKVVLAARQAVSEWNQPGMYWPDDWSRWQRALDDALPGQTILLEDLTQTPARPAVGLRTGNQDSPSTSAQPEDTAGQRADAEGTPGETDAGQRRRSTGTGRPAQETPSPGPGQHAPAQIAGDKTATPDTARATPQAAAEASAPPLGSRTGTGTHPVSGEPADSSTTAPQTSPLTNSDLAAELRRLPGFARWLSQAGASPAAGDLDSQRAGAGSSAICDERGIEITISGPGFTRHGLVTWPQAASWIDNGVTPARLGLAVIADRLSAFCRDHRDQLIAAGTCDPDTTGAELGQIRDTAVAMIVEAALRSRGAAVPVPPARPDDPAWYTAVMTTRPARGAGKAENAALERLTQVRTLIREPQPMTAAEIRATLQQRIGYGLAAMVRALDDPAAVRAWISGQASRPVPDGYDNSGERWHGTSPDGLITDRNGDDRAPGCIRWEDIPAWIQPGITSSLRDRLLAAADASSAVFRRTVSAAVRKDPGAAPGEEEDKQARERLREATDAAWAAIEAAPPPSPADLDRARRDYRDWRPVQQTLFDDPPQDSTPTPGGTRATAFPQPRPAPAAPPAPADTARPAATAAAPPAAPPRQPGPPGHPATSRRPGPAPVPAPDAGAHHPDTDPPDQRTIPEHDQPAGPRPGAASPRAAGPPRQSPQTSAATPAGPSHDDDPEPPQTPATNSDLAVALHHVSDQELNRFLTRGETPHHGSRGWRRDGLPDAGASEDIDFDRAGVRITVASRGFRRHGQISWRHVTSWIDTGLTPARLGIIIAASGLHMYAYARRDELIAAGKDNVDAAIRELSQISTDAIDAALSAALGARDADAPVPPARSGEPAYRSMAMLTGPDPSATQEENTALARIAELGAAIRGTQPVTPADIKGTIRWWIGDSLPEYARALASPEAMRAWIRRQGSGPASRPGHGTYDNGRYYSAYPEGLRTSQGSDTRVAPWILWEEIPAWIQPGLSASLRDQLAAAESRPAPGRTRTAAARPPAGAADPPSQADDSLPGPLREAVNAAWAAIEAAPPPSPADLDHARTSYRATGTAQQALPGSPAKTGQPGRTVAPAPRPEAGPRPASPPQAAPAAHHQDELPPAAAADMPAGTGTGTRPRREPAALPQPAATSDPLTDDDMFLGISRLPAFVIGDLFYAIDTGQPLAPVSRQLAPYSGERAAGEPGPGARETVSAEPAGLRIQVNLGDSRRAGLITWRQVDDLLRPGITPARRQIVTQAWRVRVSFMAANASFRAVGEGRLAAAAEEELRAQAAAAVTAILAVARPAAGGQHPQPPDETATVQRIADLAAALPSQPPRPRMPAGQVTTGDIIGHPGYRFQPFRVLAPPRDTGTAVEITGRLTEPTGAEPAGQILLTLPRTGRPGPIVSLTPVPARSLRPLFPGHDAVAGSGQPAPAARPDRTAPGPAGTAGAPSGAVPAPDAGAPASQPHAPGTRSQEETMPPAAGPAAPQSPASPQSGAAPQAPPDALAPPAGTGQPDTGRDAPVSRAAARPGGGTSLMDELERVLYAIRERRRTAAAAGGPADDDFTDIRAAFAAMRSAFGLSAASPETGGPDPAGPGQPAPAAAPAAHAPRAPRGKPAPADDGFADIQAAFADLRDVLGLPARGRHARSDAPPDKTGAAIAGVLDQAAAEAQACARWYRGTPEWQRIGTVSRAARDLVTAIREAAGDYWAEIRLDIRVRGFARTLAARTALAVSGAAHVLAGRLERAGHRDSRAWRAAWRLHQATATFASRVMRYTPPAGPDRVGEARRIIEDLGQRQDRPGQPGPGRHAAPRSAGGTRTPDAAALASASFPVMVSRANARQATAAPAARTAVRSPGQRAARRQ